MKFLVISLVFFSIDALATEFTCNMGNLTRKVEVVTTDNGCEVKYHKPSENVATQTIWVSDYQANCNKKALSFAKDNLQTKYGWNCGLAASNATVSENNSEVEVLEKVKDLPVKKTK